MQRRVIVVLCRRAGVEQQVERFLGRAVDIDATAAHLPERYADRVVARNRLRAGARLADRAAAPPAAHGLEPRHLQHQKRLA